MNTKCALKIDPADNVATLVETAQPGDQVGYDGAVATAVEPIQAGHKIALALIPEGAPVVKYGEVIGIATLDIAPGSWVHTHNVTSPPRPTRAAR